MSKDPNEAYREAYERGRSGEDSSKNFKQGWFDDNKSTKARDSGYRDGARDKINEQYRQEEKVSNRNQSKSNYSEESGYDNPSISTSSHSIGWGISLGIFGCIVGLFVPSWNKPAVGGGIERVIDSLLGAFYGLLIGIIVGAVTPYIIKLITNKKD